MEKYANMSLSELQSALDTLLDDLDDLELMRESVLGQTGVHVESGSVKRFAAQLSDCKTKSP